MACPSWIWWKGGRRTCSTKSLRDLVQRKNHHLKYFYSLCQRAGGEEVYKDLYQYNVPLFVIFIYGSVASTSHMTPLKPPEGQKCLAASWSKLFGDEPYRWPHSIGYGESVFTLQTLGTGTLRRVFTHTTMLFSHFLSPILSSPNVTYSPNSLRSKNILKLFFAYAEQLSSLQPLSSVSCLNFS